MIYTITWATFQYAGKATLGKEVKDYAAAADRYTDAYYQSVYGPYKKLIPYIGYSFDRKELLAQVIKESEDNSFVFVLINNQLEGFRKWLSDNGLEDYVVYNMPQPVTNPVHPDNDRNLTLYVLASSKHAWREMYE